MLGLGMMGAGILIAIGGVVGMLASGPDRTAEALATTTTTSLAPTDPTDTQPVSPVTTEAPATTTTTPPPTTTTSIDEATLVESFVPEFAEAITRADTDFLFETMHPVVLEVFDQELCRSYIENEILLLQQYRIVGQIAGPTSQIISGTTLDVYSVPVAFTFQGQDFETEATFAIADGVAWFTECR